MKRLAVVIFVSVHALALMVESIPRQTTNSMVSLFQEAWQPLTEPYVRFTQQWQHWNLFAPEPATVRTEARFTVNGTEVMVLSSARLPWWRRAVVLKMVRTLSREDEKYASAREELLDRLCGELALVEGARLHLSFAHSPVTASFSCG